MALALAAAPAAAQAPQASKAQPPPVPLVAVDYDQATLDIMLEAGLDVIDIDTENQRALVLVHANERRFLARHSIRFEVLNPNVNVFHEPDPADAGTQSHQGRTNYRTLSEYYSEMQSIASQYPGLTRLTTIGSSHQSRPIRALEISSNPGADDGRPEHVHMALHHAREWPSGELALDLAWHLVENYGSDQQVTDIVDDIRVYIIPVVNPDGFNYSRTTYPMWRKNRNPSGAVDSNRNYGYYWGGPGSSGSSGSQTYRGIAPFSEPETRAIRDFYSDKHPVTTITGHTHGGWWLFPWGHKYGTPPDQELYDLAEDSVEHNGYVDGPTASTLYQASGDTTDWAYGAYRSLSFTPEYVTSGSFHPPYLGSTQYPHVIVGSTQREGRYITGSVSLNGQTGRLVDCGLALAPSNCPSNTSGAIALIERGGDTFANKALNAASRGAIGAVIYNNTSGHINGTLGGISVPIPVVGIPRTDGLALLGQVGSDATLDVLAAGSYASLWYQQLPALLLNIEAAEDYAAHIAGTVTNAVTGTPVTAELELSVQRRAFTSSGSWMYHQHESSITATGSFDWAVLPSRQPELTTPSYTLRVEAPGYQTQTRSVTLNGYGSQAQYAFQLQPSN
jgi:hypothetical protein